MILKLHNLKNEFPNFNIDELKKAYDSLQKSIDRSLIKIVNLISAAIIILQLMFILHLDNRLLFTFSDKLFLPRVLIIIFSVIIIIINFLTKMKVRGLHQLLFHHILSNICMTAILCITRNNQNIMTTWIILMVLVMGIMPIPIRHSILIYIPLIPVYILINLAVHKSLGIHGVLGIVRPMLVFGIPALLFKNYFLKTLELLFLKKTIGEGKSENSLPPIIENENLNLELNIKKQFNSIEDNNKELIFIVDENIINLHMFNEDLKERYSVILFKEFKNFIENFFSLKKPDLIIFGNNLNKIKINLGCQTIRKQYNYNELPIIIAKEHGSKNLNFSFDIINDYISTPIVKDELLFRISNLLKSKKVYLKNRDSENLISLIESIIIMTHDIKSLDTDELLKEYIDTLYSFIKDFNGEEHLKYRERLSTLSKNLHPFMKENPYIARLVTMLSGFRPEKESFSSFIKRYKISKHQAEIIKLMFEGETTHSGLAEKIGKTKSNISSTLNRIYNKVGVSNQSELMLNIENIYFEE